MNNDYINNYKINIKINSKMIVKYEVIQENSTSAICEVINMYIKNGYELQGGISSFVSNGEVFYLQAVTKS